jgi:hypothetical protein
MPNLFITFQSTMINRISNLMISSSMNKKIYWKRRKLIRLCMALLNKDYFQNSQIKIQILAIFNFTNSIKSVKKSLKLWKFLHGKIRIKVIFLIH